MKVIAIQHFLYS